MPRKPRAPALTERLWRYVTRGSADQCWLWNGLFLHALPAVRLLKIDWQTLDVEKQFGSILARQDCSIPAARVVWGVLNGPVPVDNVVANMCHNASCVNPAHHKLGLRQDVSNNIVKNQNVPTGERSGTATMSNELAKTIFDEYHEGNATQRELADQYGVTLYAIRSLCQGKTWISVTGAPRKTWARDHQQRKTRAKVPRNRFIEKG